MKYIDYIPQADLSQIKSGLLTIDFQLVDKYDPTRAEVILNNLPSTLNSFREECYEPCEITFKNLPKILLRQISELGTADVEKLVTVKGIVLNTSEIYSFKKQITYECLDCGTRIDIAQDLYYIHYNNRCICGARSWKEIDCIKENRISFRVQEDQSEITHTPFNLKCIIPHHLCRREIFDKLYQLGMPISVSGILKEVQIESTTGKKTPNKLTKYLEVYALEFTTETSVVLNETDVATIETLASNPDVMGILVNSFAPHIYAGNEIKEPLILQLFGGCKHDERGIYKRGDMHILMIGDASCGKTQLARFMATVAPKSRYTTGTHSSGVGLTTSLGKDEETGHWYAQAGAMVLANNGICCVDEFSNIKPEDKAKLKDALETQVVSIAKAGINAEFPCRTSLLAACNPKLSKFDLMKPLPEQFDIESALLSRFDVKIVFLDAPNADKDGKIADAILSLVSTDMKQKLDIDLLKKYVIYAKTKITQISMPKEAKEYLKELYIGLRSKGNKDTIPIVPRQLEAILRMAQAKAKIHLRDNLTLEDIKYAYDLSLYWLMRIGMTENGLDANQALTGELANDRAIVREMESLLKTNGIMSDIDLVNQLSAKCQHPERIGDILESLYNRNEIMHPRHGLVQLVRG